MPQLKSIGFCILYIILDVYLISCNKETSHTAGLLDMAERLIEQSPDSALACLDSIRNPYELSKAQYNRYWLLEIQAKYKAGRSITTDSIIFQVKEYYVLKKDDRNAALAFLYCGRVFQEQKKQKEALSHFLEAEKYTDDDFLNGLIQSAIGVSFYDQLLEEDAIPYFRKAVDNFHKAGNTKNEIITFNQLGNCFLLMHAYDSTFYYYHKGIKLAEAVKDSAQLTKIRQSLGVLYREKGDYRKAKQAFTEAMPYAVDETERTRIYLNLAKVFKRENQKDSSLYYLNQVLALQGKVKDNYLLANIYLQLSKTEESQANFHKALEHHKSYTHYLS